MRCQRVLNETLPSEAASTGGNVSPARASVVVQTVMNGDALQFFFSVRRRDCSGSVDHHPFRLPCCAAPYRPGHADDRRDCSRVRRPAEHHQGLGDGPRPIGHRSARRTGRSVTGLLAGASQESNRGKRAVGVAGAAVIRRPSGRIRMVATLAPEWMPSHRSCRP